MKRETTDKAECKHPSMGKEYIRGMDTGDKVCLTCDAVFSRAELKAMGRK